MDAKNEMIRKGGTLLDACEVITVASVDGAGGARTVEQLFAQIDALSETVEDERAEEILGALYDYAEAIVPEA